MPRRLFDSEYIFGLHEPGGEQIMLEAGRPGWLLFTEEIGRDPSNFSGKDFTPWSNRNLGIICRLNHGYQPNGALPPSIFYEDFARRCANYVANSQGCKIWIIGNEPNFAVERPTLFTQALPPAQMPLMEEATPSVSQRARALFKSLSRPLVKLTRSILRGVSHGMGDAALFVEPIAAAQTAAPAPLSEPDPLLHGAPERFNALRPTPAADLASHPLAVPTADNSEPITPERYARCYHLCREAIHRIPGHVDDQVIVAPAAPWNNQTRYPDNPNGDWVQYLQDILRILGDNGCDGIALHTYTHGADPNLIHDEARMNPPFQNRRYHFRAYQDFMQAIPHELRHLPVYITETDQDTPWLDQNNGWVQRAYGEIDFWNRQPGSQQIRALILYRWPPIDKWVIANKAQVIADFRQALVNDYRWRSATPAPAAFKKGDQVETLDVVNLRRTPGFVGKTASDVLLQAPLNARLVILNANTVTADQLLWWNVRTSSGGHAVEGWVAQNNPAGLALLRVVEVVAPSPPPPLPPPTRAFQVGDSLRTTTLVRLRRTPGLTNKAAEDVLAELPTATDLRVLGGPATADGLIWWRLGGVNPGGSTLEGWAAASSPTGQVLLERTPTVLPPPPPTGKFQIGAAIITRTLVRLRRTPGLINKPADDVLAEIGQGVRGAILDGPRPVDNLTWWQVSTSNAGGQAVTGWMAEAGPDGLTLIEKATPLTAPPPPPSPPPQGSFAIGELVVASDLLRVRRTPGLSNKPAEDTLGAFEPRTTLNILEGPVKADGLTWWRVGGITLTVGEAIGWVAEKTATGVVLVVRPAKLPGTNIPDQATRSYLAAPFQGSFEIGQLWGENPAIYNRISYDGVPLKGHNGIDFLTPTGSNIVAVENGTVLQAVLNDPSGLGNYVKLGHTWGESLYAHLQSLSVQNGQSVQRGQVIGQANSTGFSSGPHLHFAIRIHPFSRTDGWGGFSDPLPYMNINDVHLPIYVRQTLERPAASLPFDAPLPLGESAPSSPLAQAPGYAPDQSGVVRP